MSKEAIANFCLNVLALIWVSTLLLCSIPAMILLMFADGLAAFH